MMPDDPRAIARGLTKAQARGLIELEAASRDFPDGWCRTWDLSGSPGERSARNMHSLVDHALAVALRYGETKQAQWRWKITDLGRAVAAALREDEDGS